MTIDAHHNLDARKYVQIGEIAASIAGGRRVRGSEVLDEHLARVEAGTASSTRS